MQRRPCGSSSAAYSRYVNQGILNTKSILDKGIPRAGRKARSKAAELLGPEGRALWVSAEDYLKLHPDHVVLFNAVVFNEAGRCVWFGDIDLSLMLEALQDLAEEIGAIAVAPEKPFAGQGIGDHINVFESRQRADNAARWYSLFVFTPGNLQAGRLRVQGMSDEVLEMLANRAETRTHTETETAAVA
jgi:hypothetical protein